MTTVPDTAGVAPDSFMSRAYRLGWALVIGLLLLQFWSRYMPSPRTELVGDDWSNLARSKVVFASTGDAVRAGMVDPNRPLSNTAVFVVYRWFGDRPLYWTLLSLAGNSLLLLFTVKMALELTGRRLVGALTGVVFALLPNLTETYLWSTQILNEVACALVPYALSGWMWVAYVRRGGGWRLAVSALAYGVGLFSYEAGLFLPAAYLVLLPWRREPVKSVLRMVPLGLAGLFYVAWRTTSSFGLLESSPYPSHMQAGISLVGVGINVWQLFHWWLGERMIGAMVTGWQMFGLIAQWPRRLLFLANLVVVLGIGRGLARLACTESAEAKPMPSLFASWQVWGFAAAWTAAALALSVISYTGARLNVIPAMGVSLLAALALARVPVRRWVPVVFLPAFLALVANQGTAENWRQSGAFQRRLYERIQATTEDWQAKKILVIDTRALRQRLTPGLLSASSRYQDTWANYGSALLIRGFVPSGMAMLATGTSAHGVHVMLDVEYGARVEGDTLHWHARYDPSRPFATPMQDVWVLDAFEAALN